MAQKSKSTVSQRKRANQAPDPDDALVARRREHEEFADEFHFTSADAEFLGFNMNAAVTRGVIKFPDVKDEYTSLWAEMAIRKAKLTEIDGIVSRIVQHKDKYQAVERLTNVPWYVISVLHNLEASGKFDRHLHNGDPLTAHTVNVPAGRPASGTPPFTWEESAVDALGHDGLTHVTDWSVEHLAYLFEGFNGWGYRRFHPHVKSPYLWSYSNHYTKGKYVADGQWSETAVSRQCGAMVLLKRLEEGGHIRLSIRSAHGLDHRSSFARLAEVDGEMEEAFPREAPAAAAAPVSRPVNTQMTDGPGIFGYYDGNKRYGTASTIAALREVGRIWNLRRSAPRVGVGDISLQGGGDIGGHASHETGRDVDLRPIRNDGTEGPLTWSQTKYSRALTQELIDIIYANGIVKVNVIGFNDPGIEGCVHWNNHDNHLHVRFYFLDEQAGYPVLRLGQHNSPAVREFQRRLNVWIGKTGGGPALVLDGDFGQGTRTAVKNFQAAMGLGSDGVVGTDAWKKSLDFIVP